MIREITSSDLKKIRTELEKVEGVIITKNNIIIASIALPEPCDSETVEYANELCRRLQGVNCRVDISQILQFVFRSEADKNYEVLPYIPVGVPCIRVYPKSNRDAKEQQPKNIKTLFAKWKKLISLS